MRGRRSTAVSTVLLLAIAGAALVASGDGPSSRDAQAASSSSTSVLGQLRRNAKVSERLNAGFFRAPQTRSYVGSAFQPADSDIGFRANRGDSGLSLDPARKTGTFEFPLDIPNRAKIVKVQASYKDLAGNNSTLDSGVQTPSGFGFYVIKLGLLGENAAQLLALPAGSDPVLGYRSVDGRTGTDTLAIAGSGFAVDNSRNRYVLRVRIDDPSGATRFYGMTVQYVIGTGVPGAPK